MCPKHSVCVPCPCGLKKILLKLVELPSDTFPIQSPNFTGSISGFSIYHAIGLASVLDNGMEISMGFDKSISIFWIFAIIYAELVSASFQPNMVVNKILFYNPKYKSFNSGFEPLAKFHFQSLCQFFNCFSLANASL